MNNCVTDISECRSYSKIKFLLFLPRQLNFNKEEIIYTPDIYIFRYSSLGRLVDQNSFSKMTIVDLNEFILERRTSGHSQAPEVQALYLYPRQQMVTSTHYDATWLHVCRINMANHSFPLPQ